jgi:xanthine dehydrogenase accessory factor
LSGRFIDNRVVIRGAGEMASGVIKRLFLIGFEVIALEQEQPDCIRRTVCFAEAVYEGEATIESVTARLIRSPDDVSNVVAEGCVPLLIDTEGALLPVLSPLVVVDARMLKQNTSAVPDLAPIVIGLGPGFIAGTNCHAAIETNRGFDLGRVFYDGAPQAYTGVPSPIEGVSKDRLLCSPADGKLKTTRRIGDEVEAGEIAGEVSGRPVKCLIGGVLRGLARDGLTVKQGQKIGDIDPRRIRGYCFKISDKANAIAGGVVEAIYVLKRRSNLM